MALDTETRRDPYIPPLLRLPLELRRQIFEYVLPCTTTMGTTTGKAHVWLRGCTSLLAVNEQIHEETADLMYGDTVFVVEVLYESIIFRYRRLLSSGLVPQTTPAFLDTISPRNIQRIRNIAINVVHVDSYTGIIKHNCGGPGLTEGLRSQVMSLVMALVKARDLQNVRVNVTDHNRNFQAAQHALEPFQALDNIRGSFLLTGHMHESEKVDFLARMRSGQSSTL